MKKLSIQVIAKVVVDGPNCHFTCAFLRRSQDERKSCTLFDEPLDVEPTVGAPQRTPKCIAAERMMG